MIASMCQPGTKIVEGSTTCHAWRTNSRRLRVASSRSTFTRAFGLANQEAKLFEFFIAKLGEFGCGTNHDRTAVRTSVLVGEIILVAEQILGQENIRRRVALVSQGPQVPAKRDTSPSLPPRHCFSKRGLALPALDGSRADVKN